MSNTQKLVVDTIVGPKEVEAPTGWAFDETAVIVWAKMLTIARDLAAPPRRQRKYQRLANEAQFEVLGNILANALGMAGFYWTQNAKLFSKEQL